MGAVFPSPVYDERYSARLAACSSTGPSSVVLLEFENLCFLRVLHFARHCLQCLLHVTVCRDDVSIIAMAWRWCCCIMLAKFRSTPPVIAMSFIQPRRYGQLDDGAGASSASERAWPLTKQGCPAFLPSRRR